ncbi:MAG: ECF transporter S component [Deltaproteobacteria bacterium]|nr:ECF transporter S component [Deltaproteobacteria bacterium]
MKKSHIVLIAIVAVAAGAFIVSALRPDADLLNWGVLTAVLAALVCLALFFEFETAVTSSKEIALVAMLSTISAVLRVPFAAIPNVQPCTYIIICSGYVFGPIAGFAVGAMTALVSNFFLGHGPWTLYQMIAWGLAGLSAGYLRKLKLNTAVLIVIGVVWGYLYGLITNLWYWTAFIYPLTLKTFLVTELNTVWFDTLHAAGNAVFLGVLGAKTIAILRRFKERFSIIIEASS